MRLNFCLANGNDGFICVQKRKSSYGRACCTKQMGVKDELSTKIFRLLLSDEALLF